MDSIGERLRQERLRRGLDITDIAEYTKIHASMLEAIEADDLERLPGSFFTRSFVRQYARALGLDESEFETDLKRMTGYEEAEAQELSEPRLDYSVPPLSAGRSHGPGHSLGALVAFLLIVAACSGIYVLWQRTRELGAEPPQARNPSAVRRTTPPAPVAPAGGQTPQPQVVQPAPAPAAGSAPPAEIVRSSAGPDEEAAVRLQIRAREEVWVRVVGDRKLLYEGTLLTGQQLRLDAVAYLRTRVGRPEAVEMTWNGQKLGDVGVAGEPQTVEFTSQRFRIVPAAPAPPEGTTTPDAP